LGRGSAPPSDAPLFRPLFFVLCFFTFTVFVSLFQLLPTAPFRVLALGGTHFTAGLFLGCLTYASAFSAPLTGALSDRFGRRPVLLVTGGAITLLSLCYAFSPEPGMLLGAAVIHGFFWSGLMSAAAAYLTDLLPLSRRAEGIGYWGLASIVAIAVAPRIGFALLERGWGYVCASVVSLNVLMVVIAFFLPAFPLEREGRGGGFLEGRVLALSLTLFLYAFGYGGVTAFSALYSDACRVEPRWIFLTGFAVVTLLTRPFSARLADRVGYTPVLLPSLALIAIGLGILAAAETKGGFLWAAVIFGAGFARAYPVFVARVLEHIPQSRRGAAFGSLLLAFDTGVGTGSITTGFLVEKWGYRAAFGVAAVLAGLAAPYFKIAEGRLYPPEASAETLDS
jgi:MFS family permease